MRCTGWEGSGDFLKHVSGSICCTAIALMEDHILLFSRPCAKSVQLSSSAIFDQQGMGSLNLGAS